MKCILVSSALILLGITTASADTYVFKDIRHPHGHARSQVQKFADGRACGARNDAFQDAKLQAAVRCMRSHGWVVARIVPDPAPPVQQAQTWPRVTITTGGTYSEEELDQQEEENDEFNAQQASEIQDLQNNTIEPMIQAEQANQ